MAEHKDLPNSQLHEQKGCATAASGTSYVANGSGSGTWTILLPSISGSTGKSLTTNGTTTSWGSNAGIAAHARFANMNTTPTLTVTNNISSVTRLGTGYYRVNFTNALGNALYTPVVCSTHDHINATITYHNLSTTSFEFKHYDYTGAALADIAYYGYIGVFGYF